jgi:hypothetical protein
LIINDVTRSDSGRYEVIVDNHLGTDSAVFTIVVQGIWLKISLIGMNYFYVKIQLDTMFPNPPCSI